MHITIDTSNITDADRAILALVLDGANAHAAQQAAVIREHQERVEAHEKAASTDDGQTATPAAEPEQPKRKRRTKAEMEAARAAEAAAKEEPTDEPTPASEDAESDAAHEQETGLDEFAGVTVEQVTELATQLIQKDRPAMVELLKQFGARRVSEIPESDRGKFAAEIRSKLA